VGSRKDWEMEVRRSLGGGWGFGKNSQKKRVKGTGELKVGKGHKGEREMGRHRGRGEEGGGQKRGERGGESRG